MSNAKKGLIRFIKGLPDYLTHEQIIVSILVNESMEKGVPVPMIEELLDEEGTDREMIEH